MNFQRAVFATLSYHDIFDYPLKQSEILSFLIVNSKLKTQNSKLSSFGRSTVGRQFKTQNLKKILKKLIFKEIINYKNSFYFLPRRQKIIDLRKKREKYSQQKIKIANKLTKILAKTPFVKMIVITGALTMENADKNDDIDLLIITAKNRLWLTRMLAVLILEILGRRRRPNDKDIKDKICLNMFLDETGLSLSKQNQNLFTAHEIVQLKPIFNKKQTYENFLQQNLWVRNYLPNGIKQSEKHLQGGRMDSSEMERKRKKLIYSCLPTGRVFIDSLFNLLEKVVYRLQIKYMESKKTSEQVSLHSAFFHPKDVAKDVLRKYEKKLKAFSS